jgi:hypothetical protein
MCHTLPCHDCLRAGVGVAGEIATWVPQSGAFTGGSAWVHAYLTHAIMIGTSMHESNPTVCAEKRLLPDVSPTMGRHDGLSTSVMAPRPRRRSE